jgi:cyclopropane-fatty-acyl-phospholipid synthase
MTTPPSNVVVAGASTQHGASQRAIQHHYDLDVAFWRLWLDQRLAYSCALWDEAETLEEAQLAKLQWHARQARCRDAARVLDVGCGWGSMLDHLIEEQNVERVVGLTLSPMQREYASRNALATCEVRLEHWQQHDPEESYDAIISVGAFEHFSKPRLERSEKVAGYRAFFRKCHAWLVPDGRLSLQTVAYGNMLPESQNSYFEREIYPESELPSFTEIIDASAGLFEIELVRNDRPHYERTCREWLSRLRSHRAEAVALVGASHVDRYLRYLKYCTLGFYLGNAQLLRIVLRRNAQSRVDG